MQFRIFGCYLQAISHNPMIEFYNFLFNNRLIVSNDNLFFKNFVKILKTYFSIFVVYIIIVILLKLLGFNETEKPFQKDLDVPEIPKIILVIIVMPIIEEIVFRLSLVPKRLYINISIIFANIFCYFALNKISTNEIYYNTIFITILLVTLYLFNKNFESVISFIKKNSRLFIHILAIVFCLFHINNYNFDNRVGAFYALLFVLINAYFYSFVRLKYGFIYVILIHMFNNFIPSIPLLLKLL